MYFAINRNYYYTHRLTRFLFGLFILFIWQFSVAQTHKFTNYALVEGLSQSEVYAIHEDHAGYIWIGTHGGGLNRFNGIDFELFTSFDGLPNNGILALYQDNQDNLWIGTDNGLAMYDGKSFTQFESKDKSKPFVVGHIASNKKGELYFGTTHGIFTIDNGELKKSGINMRFDYLNFMYFDSQDRLIVGNENRIAVIKDNKVNYLNQKNGLGPQSVGAGISLPNGDMIASCYGGNVYYGSNGRFKKLLPNALFHGKLINEIYLDSEFRVWFGTQNSGVYTLDLKDSSVNHYNVYDGLANNHIESIYEDSWGNVWIGTGGGGLSKFHKVAFSTLNAKNGLPGDWIYSCLRRKNGEIWVGSGEAGVTVMTDSTLVNYRGLNGFTSSKIRLMFEDSDDRVWLAAEGNGLWVYDSSFHQIISDVPGVPFDHIKSITQDTSGYIWVCEGGKGLLQLDYVDSLRTVNTVNRWTTQNGLPKNYIFALHADNLNRIWFGTKSSGIGYIDGHKVVHLTTNDGLVSNNCSMITEDENGYIWIAGGDGISRISAFKRDLPIYAYTYKDGVIGIPVYQVYPAPNGFLWVGTTNGVTRFENKNGELSQATHFGYGEGFEGLETNTNAVCHGNDGKMYFGTGAGVMVFQGSKIEQKNRPPILHIKQINLFYEPLYKKFPAITGTWGTMIENLDLAHDQNNLSFDFYGINHLNPDKVEYSWKLENFESDWSPASKQTTATYSNLPPGVYTFKVKARTAGGKWSPEVVTKQFTIQDAPPPPPPFYQTTWFIVSVSSLAALILGLIAIIWYIRLRRERERIKLERNMIELEQKALRLQMNPHFILNALNSIQSLISTQDTKKARYQLAKFSKLMRQILDNSRVQMISLEDEISTLENYLAIEKFSSGNQFEYTINDGGLEISEIEVPPMMLQPFAENAIIHGMKHIEHTGHISINFSIEESLLVCEIDDNGCGRKKAAENKSQIAQQHKSAALVVTQERLEILHDNKRKNSLEIIDKYEDDKPKGTKVIIRLPLSYR